MKLVLAEPKYLKDSISIISDLVSEGTFKITKEGIELVAMDPANVAMVIFKLLSSSFVEYDLEKEVELAINLNSLKQVLRRVGGNEILTLELKDNRLRVEFKSRTKRTFELPIIDMEEKEQKVPNLEFPVTVAIDSSVLNQAIEDADVVAESVSLVAEPGKFSVVAEGDLSRASLEIEGSEDAKIVAETKVKAKYSIEYLKKIIAGSKISDKVVIMFNKDYPLRVDYKVLNKIDLGFILAPRVDND